MAGDIPLYEPTAHPDLELADMKRLHALNLRLLNGGELRVLLREVLQASADLMQTDQGNVQLYNHREQALNIVADLGFSQEFLDYFRSVPVGYSVCGTAMANRERIIMEDASTDPRFVEFASLYAKFGFVAVQSTPLIGRDGRFLGMLSNHFKAPRRPDIRETQLLDLFAQQAVWVIERDQAEEALRESERRFRTLANSTPVLMWLNDPSGAIFVNKAYLDFLGLKDQDGAEGFKWTSHLHPEDEVAYVEAYLKCVETQMSFTAEFRFRRHDGEYRWMQTVAWPRIDDQGQCLGYVGTTFDITHIKQAQLESERSAQELEHAVMRRTQELVSSQADLRALAVQLNLTEQRERKQLATELHDHLQQILVLGKMQIGQGKRFALGVPGCESMMKKVDDILSEALTYTRTLVAELSPPVLRDHGLAAGLKWLGEYMKKFDLAVTVSVPEKITLPEDQALLLYQSVRELLMNTWKHASAGHAIVSLDQRHGELQIQVRDEGQGFDLAVIASVNSNDGTSKFGLLSIRERMRAMGGSFDIQSQPSRGTLVTLILPVGDTHAVAQVVPEKMQALSGNQIGNARSDQFARVLLVDDHAMMRQGLRSILTGYSDLEVVGEAANGVEALCAVEQHRPAVVIMDINMPEMDGVEATVHLKTRYPDMRVIGLSVNAGRENQEAMLKAGASLLLTKEAAVEQLYGAIQDVIKTGHITQTS